MIEVEEFKEQARTWLAANKATAPKDYGAITPPDLINPAKEWQRRLYDSGFAGIHWPTEFGGRGLTAAHNATWMEQCALAGVPPVLTEEKKAQ